MKKAAEKPTEAWEPIISGTTFPIKFRYSSGQTKIADFYPIIRFHQAIPTGNIAMQVAILVQIVQARCDIPSELRESPGIYFVIAWLPENG